MTWKKGQSGNPNGRKLGSFTKVKALEDAIKVVEKDRSKKPLLEYVIRQAYKNDNVLIAVLRKLVPDLKAIEFSGDAVITSAFDLTALNVNELKIFRSILAKIAAKPSAD